LRLERPPRCDGEEDEDDGEYGGVGRLGGGTLLVAGAFASRAMLDAISVTRLAIRDPNNKLNMNFIQSGQRTDDLERA
jgi:hypothetical protein